MKRYLALFLIVLFTLSCSTSAFAAWPKSFEGKPGLQLNGENEAYFIWHDPDGVHIRVLTDGPRHVFTGSISTDGRLENIMVKTTDDGDFSRLSDAAGKLRFRLTATDNPVGIDFTINGGETVKFTLEIDGDPIKAKQIFVGAESWNPGNPKFTIYYSDDPEEERESHTTVILGIDWFGWVFGHPGHGHGHGHGHWNHP